MNSFLRQKKSEKIIHFPTRFLTNIVLKLFWLTRLNFLEGSSRRSFCKMFKIGDLP